MKSFRLFISFQYLIFDQKLEIKTMYQVNNCIKCKIKILLLDQNYSIILKTCLQLYSTMCIILLIWLIELNIKL